MKKYQNRGVKGDSNVTRKQDHVVINPGLMGLEDIPLENDLFEAYNVYSRERAPA